MYTAGDNGDICNSLACFGGVSGPCVEHEGVWAFREVHCAPLARKGVTATAADDVVADAPDAGVCEWRADIKPIGRTLSIRYSKHTPGNDSFAFSTRVCSHRGLILYLSKRKDLSRRRCDARL